MKPIQKIATGVFLVFLLVAVPGFAQIVESKVIAVNPYFSKQMMLLPDGREIEKNIINGPPSPPKGFVRTTAALPEPNPAAGINIISDVPAFTWCFGCSPTSAAMIAGYYDRNGYPEMYTGPTNGGVMPLNNDLYWPTWIDGCGVARNRCPLSATQMGLDGRTTKGHVDDYWVCYEHPGPDPFTDPEPGWTEHTHADCTADFMGTSQASDPINNTDGSTTFWHYNDGSTLITQTLYDLGPEYYQSSGLCGIQEFYESRGYTVEEAFNQYIYPYFNENTGTWNTQGFTYEQYKAEIDAGRPVMIHVEGHTMIGIGYDDSTETMYIHDTWGHSSENTMIWGETYFGMEHYAVSIVRLSPPIIPEITITSPQIGNAWQAGSTQTITWSYFGSPDAHIKIELFKGGSLNRTIVAQTPAGPGGTGSYSWRIPNTQTPGDDYTITVTSTTNSACFDSSGMFFITAPPDGVKAMPWLKLLLLD